MNRSITGLLTVFLVIFGVIIVFCVKFTEGENSKDEVKIVKYFPVTYINTKSIQKEYVDVLSNEELNLTHITGMLMEHVILDADMTPYSRYKDGLNSYHVGLNRERIDSGGYPPYPTIFFENLENVQFMFERKCKGNFHAQGEEWDGKQKQKLICNLISSKTEENKKLISLQLNANRSGLINGSDIYREVQNVIDANEVLQLVKQNLNANLSLMQITIYDMELCYSSYYLNEEEGKFEYMVSPFWVVRCWDGVHIAEMIFDAVKGTYCDQTEWMLLWGKVCSGEIIKKVC